MQIVVRMQEQIQMLRELVGMVRRRIVLFSLVALLGVLASVFYAVQSPRVYETVAVIQIESPQISSELARSTATEPTMQRIKLIEQRLMSRENLLAVIEKYGLFADAPGLSPVDRVDLMRRAITLNTISDWSGYGVQPPPSALTIIVRLSDPEKAALVANEMVTGVLEGNVQARSNRLRETLDFFAAEERRLAENIATLDTQIVTFKSGNDVALPDGLEFRRDELTRLSENSDELRRQIRALQRERLSYETSRATSVDPNDDTALDAEIRRLEAELASRKQILSADNPYIRRLEAEIAVLASDQNRAHAEMVAGQIQLIDQDIALLEQQLDANAARSAELRAQIAKVPEVENRLNGLLREREQLSERYAAAVRSRAEAETAQRLELGQQAERFEVLEAALVPEYPIAPSRKKIVALGGVASLAAGFGLVFLLDLLNPVLRTTGQMRRQLDITPVIAIPYMPTSEETRRRRIMKVLAIVLIVIVLPIAALMVNFFVMPIAEIAQLYRGKAAL